MRRLLIALGLMALAPSALLTGCSSTTPVAATPGTTTSQVVASDPNQQNPTPNNDAPNPNGSWIGVAAGSDAFVPGAQDTFVAVWVDVPKDNLETHAPADVALVIDTSGSMSGDKIRNARAAAQKLVDNLRDGDIVSVHTFSDAVQERVSPTRLDASSRSRIASVLTELNADGGTNLFEGVRAAGMAAMSAPPTHLIRRVVLISDGIATVGMTARSNMELLGDKAGERGVQITAIGVGLDYDELTLNALAMKSAGRLYHMENTAALPEIVASEMGLLKSTRAADTKVAIVPAPGVQLVGVEGAQGRWQSGGALEVPLGSMFGGQHKEFIVRARLNAPESGTHPVASVRLVFLDPKEGNLERIQEAVARFDVVNDASVAMSRKNVRAQNVFAMIDASLATERAAQAVNTDDFAGADRAFEEAEKKLRSQAAVATTAADKSRLEASATRVSQARAGASAAAAAPPAAKPAAKRKMSLEANDAAMDMQGF
ncbi:MAG TPA: VWA domain-containing protein [Polyangiaceae bacterium]|nr:VWA domain-containing protein [Polyangiaceae bacterium]